MWDFFQLWVERQLWRRRGVVGLWDCDASRLQAGLPCTGLRLTNNSSLPCLSWSGSLIILWTLNSHHVDEENWKISLKYLPIDENWGITPEWRFRVEIPLEMKQRLSVAWILSTLIFKAADDSEIGKLSKKNRMHLWRILMELLLVCCDWRKRSLWIHRL